MKNIVPIIFWSVKSHRLITGDSYYQYRTVELTGVVVVVDALAVVVEDPLCGDRPTKWTL